MKGDAIWDDFIFLFNSHAITQPGSYDNILLNFGWPLSVIAQKLLFSLWQFDYFYYHLINLALHFLNSYLLLRFAEKLKFPFAFALFFLFLLHPANVISVAWIIQFKTLMCFTFALISCYYFEKGHENKKWYGASLFFLACSLLSKSASLPLPAVFFLLLFMRGAKKEFLWLIPFFLLSFVAGYRLMNSPVTVTALKQLDEKVPKIAESSDNEIEEVTTSEKKEVLPPTLLTPAYEDDVYILPPMAEIDEQEDIPEQFSIVPSAVHYYLWQSLVPIHNEPVKGFKYSAPGIVEIIHFIFLLLIIVLNWRRPILYALLSGYVMLTPFLGIIPAPFMNLTWVSDQHLYLILPFFLIFWLMLVEKIDHKWKIFVPYLLIPVFCFFVRQASPYYKNEIAFFNSSLKADPLNTFIAYNLAASHVSAGNMREAFEVTNSMVEIAPYSYEVRNSTIYASLLNLHIALQGRIEKMNNEN